MAACEAAENVMVVCQFGREMESELDAIFLACSTCKLQATKREKVWSKFHSFRCNKLTTLWKGLLVKLDVSGISVR